jgi:hypothetical protein
MDFAFLAIFIIWVIVILVMQVIWPFPLKEAWADISQGGLKSEAYYLAPLFIIVALYGIYKLLIGA